MSENSKIKNLFSSEFVSVGHPDKVADQISDAVVDFCLKADPNSRVACEVLATNNNVFVGGEVRVPESVFNNLDAIIDEIVRNVFRDAGYVEQSEIINVVNSLNVQSSDIALGVDADGAGDQGMMFGYAVKGFNDELMPLEYSLARNIILNQEEARKNGELHGWLLPDAKAQITLDRNTGKVETVVLSTQHTEDAIFDELEEYCIHTIIADALGEYFHEDINFLINPTGRFVTGGTVGDAGLTGRKIIVDTYGGVVPHGGGAFCVDAKTKYLTETGLWKNISEYKGGKVGQWNPETLKIEFVLPSNYIVCDAVDLIHFVSNTVDMVVSTNHDVVLSDMSEVDGFPATFDVSFPKVKAGELVKLLKNNKDDFGYAMIKGKSYSELEEVFDEGVLMLNDTDVFQFVDDKMYCFTVPTGMFVAKREKEPFVTGNSGKDSTKVDRSGAYMARYIAKNIVASGITDECTVQLSYAIGVAEPVGLYIEGKGLTAEQNDSLSNQVRNQMSLTPRGIIDRFGLRDPKFYETSKHGHFGNEDFAWEKLDLKFEI